jgi:hypothetical protein
MWFPAYFALAMFSAALNSKALGVSLCFALSLVALYPDSDKAGLTAILFLPAYLLASFRD